MLSQWDWTPLIKQAKIPNKLQTYNYSIILPTHLLKHDLV